MQVLKDNYLMIGIDGSLAQNGSDWFCYHVTSPCIFPVSFCEVNNLELTPPRGKYILSISQNLISYNFTYLLFAVI